MCGIVGLFDVGNAKEISRSILERMNQALFHRGPDEGDVHIEPGLGLGHRRLSIIDLSSGQQPLFNEDHSVVVVFNGEIYNFQELMPELTALGHKFRTRSDTEVIVHAWEQWGEACVNRFRGMFAFALWDRNRQTLFLARDRLGVKPMFYAILPDNILVFGSELKALLCHPKLSLEIDPRSVEDYFAYGYVPEPRTIYRQALKLPPGHTLTIHRGKPVPSAKEYWDLLFQPGDQISEKDAQAELIERLREAVKIRLISEVPLGAFLSGGVDSSAVVAMMAGLSNEPVNTCSISFGDPKYNESEYAREVAERYKTNHRVEQVDTDDFDLVDTLASLYDEPYADSSAMPTYRVCQLARKSVTVALSGDGGDENFGGYRRYRWHMNEEKIRSFMPLGVRRPVFSVAGKLYPKADWAPRIFRARTTLQALARSSVEAYFHTVSIMDDDMRRKLFSDSFRRELQDYQAIEVLQYHATRAPVQHGLSLIQYLDMKTYLPGDILTKVDRASMAHALEVREPLLDHPMMEWLAGLPENYKLKGQEGKYILKKSLEPYLSDSILYRPKMGFAIPLASWFRGPLKTKLRDRVLGSRLAETGFFNSSFLKHMVDQHQSGLRDYSSPLWSVLMFDSFLRLSE